MSYWFAILIIPFFTIVQKKLYDYVINSTWVRLNLGFTMYSTYLKLRGIKSFTNLVQSKNTYESQKLLFKVHQIHRKYKMDSGLPNMLGYTASLKSGAKIPAYMILEDYLKVGKQKIDKNYEHSLDLVTRHARVEEIFEDKFLGALFTHQIDDGVAYLTTICLAASTGCIFNDETYKSCLDILLKSILNMEFDTKTLSKIQIKRMIKITSCLLPSSKLGSEYIGAVTDFLNNCPTNIPCDVAFFCYNKLLNTLRG
jgi:hypothetical protein